MITKKSAFTLIELLIALVALSILVGVIISLYTSGLNLWSQGFDRGDIRQNLAQSLEVISKNLRQATSIDSITESSITFTADLGSGSDQYRFYLYHASDPEPNPPYTQTNYELRWVKGTTAYGLGALVASDIAEPPSAVFTQSGNLIGIDLTSIRGDQSLHLKTNVRPRNL